MKPLGIGGADDHVHLLLGAPATLAPAEMARLVKGGSSAWIHETFPRMKGFRWQDGYGVCAVSVSQMSAVIEYIKAQREHHRARSFQEEYRELLKRHGVEWDERYAWG
jgi:putative transposase